MSETRTTFSAFAHLWKSTRDFHNAWGDCGKGMAFGTSWRFLSDFGLGYIPNAETRSFGWYWIEMGWGGGNCGQSLRVANLPGGLFVYLLIYAATKASWGPPAEALGTLAPRNPH